MFIQIGKIINAKQTFERAKAAHELRHKESKGSLEDAVKDANNFGMFEDCGDHYHSRLAVATALHESVTFRYQEVASLEKHFKKLKHEFKELYPDKEEILANYLV